MSKIKWIIFCVLTIGGFTGLIVYSQLTKKSNLSEIDANKIQTASNLNGNIGEHIYGNSESPVIFINYSDFQCSACGSAHPQIKAIVEEYKDKIQYVFRNYPITSLHTHSKAAAGATEAAGLQNKYWEMNNKLFETQPDWEGLSGKDRDAKFEEYAKELGLDISKYRQDITSDKVNKKISYDTSIGDQIGIEGTPTFVLNGEVLKGEVWSDETKLKAAFDEAIAKSTKKD